MINKFLIVLIGIMTQAAFAESLRLDIGYYKATSWWRADEGRSFEQFDDAESGANTVTVYQRLTYDTKLNKNLNVSMFIESAKFQANDFGAGGAQEGDSISGISAVGVNFTNSIWNKGASSVALNYGVTAPGDSSLNQYKFISVNDGQTRYNLGADYSYSMKKGKVDFGLSYIYRPGFVDSKGTSDTFSNEIPDILEYSVDYYHFIGNGQFLYTGYNLSNSLSGIDIGPTDDDWKASAGGGADLPFPATKQERGEVYIGWGSYYSASNSIDISYTQVITGRNTDKGESINIGWTKNW